MISVSIFQLRDSQDVLAGRIIWDGEKLTLDPADSLLLRKILDVKISLRGERITKDQPEKFLSALRLHYKSAYLRAGPLEKQSNVPT